MKGAKWMFIFHLPFSRTIDDGSCLLLGPP